MNATNYAAKYTAKAMDAYIAYAAETDVRNAALYMDRARHYEVLAAAEKEKAAPVVQPVAVPKVEAPKVEDVRRVKAIKRFFAIARENGLDTSKAAKARMRHAIENALRRCFDSRSDITTEEWFYLGDLIKAGRLKWN